jgi:hypothetical protein
MGQPKEMTYTYDRNPDGRREVSGIRSFARIANLHAARRPSDQSGAPSAPEADANWSEIGQIRKISPRTK